MVTERTIINALILGAVFILIPFIVSSSLTVDYAPVLFFGGITAFIVAFFFLKDALSLCPLLGGSISGALNFLPLPLKATHVACIMLICYYITGYVIIRQKKIKLGKPQFLWPILGITAILLYHNHSLSLGSLGGGSEGAKPAFLIYLIVLGYFCGINIATPSVKFLNWMPLLTVVMTLVSSVPFVLSTYIPALAPYLYSITDSVNVDAYIDTLNGSGAGDASRIGRLGAFGPIGITTQLYLLSRYPIGTWFRPERWWVVALSLGCVVLVVFSGFRNVLFGFIMITMVGAWCYYSWRSLFLPGAIFIAGVVLIISANNNIINLPVDKLPSIAQRTLSFLPGDWDEDALLSAESSNSFRKNIQDVYLKEYLFRSPLIGTGFNIDRKEFEYYNAAMTNAGGMEQKKYFEAKVFIEGKLFHTGWISAYDIVGGIGMLLFLMLALSETRIVYGFLFGPRSDRRSTLYPFYVWMFCNLVTMMVSFFTVFGDFGQTFSDLCMYALVISHLSDIEATREIPVTIGERKKPLEYAGSKVGGYGYNGYNGYKSGR